MVECPLNCLLARLKHKKKNTTCMVHEINADHVNYVKSFFAANKIMRHDCMHAENAYVRGAVNKFLHSGIKRACRQLIPYSIETIVFH